MLSEKQFREQLAAFMDLPGALPHAFTALLLSPSASVVSLWTNTDQKSTWQSRSGTAAALPNRIIRFPALILILLFRQANLLLRFLPPVAQLAGSSVISFQLLFWPFSRCRAPPEGDWRHEEDLGSSRVGIGMVWAAAL